MCRPSMLNCEVLHTDRNLLPVLGNVRRFPLTLCEVSALHKIVGTNSKTRPLFLSWPPDYLGNPKLIVFSFLVKTQVL